MEAAFETRDVTKTFGDTKALDEVTLSVPTGSVVGLIGRNGSGKTTLLRHVVGMALPTSGECRTLGCETSALGAGELARIGVVHQEGRYLDWMRAGNHLRYVASFYERWDTEREARLVRELELDTRQRVGALSPGNLQKLGLVMAVCHHPELLLLDEPAGAVDPIVREKLLAFLLETVREDGNTTVVSSHAMRDIERLVDHVACLDRGRLIVDRPLDELHEQYAEWIVTGTPLPEHFAEPYVLEQEVNGVAARLVVRDGDGALDDFRARHGVEVQRRPMNLERVFPHLLES